MELIYLCGYTLKQSMNDTGEYYNPSVTAQELLEVSK